MPSVNETVGAPHQLAAGLAAGLETLSENQQIEFTQYEQVVLPLDGYVFWVNSGVTVLAQGSLHQSIDQQQNEDETMAVNRIVFTSKTLVDEFNDISPTSIYIGFFNGVRFSFNRRGPYYQQAGLYHYIGDAVYPAMESQIVDNPAVLIDLDPVVSNSLPVWLTLNKFMPMYPSYLVPANIEPPYAAVHIDPGDTEALAAAPHFSSTMTHTQLAKDSVRITLYGMNSQQALDFQDYVFQYSMDTDDIGVMNMPIIRDEKRTQSELNIIAMKKVFDVDVSYYQTRVNTIARQFITEAVAQYLPQPDPY
jgi:hypothetical protein